MTALTLDGGGTALASGTEARAFLVLQITGIDGSRVVDLPSGVDVTFGRSRGATISVDSEKVSRLHAKVRRDGDTILVTDLESRNGTKVNGEKIEGPRKLVAGDEVVLGPVTAIVGATSALRRRVVVSDAGVGEARLAAELDRSVRYRRPLVAALVRCTEVQLEALAGALRPMDTLAEDVGDDYLVVLPELDRVAAETALAKVLPTAATRAFVLCPDEGTRAPAVIARLRTLLRGGRVEPVARIADGPIVVDPAMQRVYSMVTKIADSSMTVLILGETGVGKELVTEAVHRASARRDEPFMKLNCAALAEQLLESELFGHERGAFTGADRKKLGFFEAASGGTLFLDEVGEMPASLQAKLLRVLERKVITRVGGTAEIPIDVRVVAATHRDLETEVREGRFRQDLLFRISGFTVFVPPLRDRPSEILPLAQRFAGQVAFSDDARAALLAYAWPGNVRELQNAITRALVLCEGTITGADLPDRLRDVSEHVRAIAETPTADVRGQLADIERAALVAALSAENDNQTRAARRLGLSRRALIYKMEKYGLKPPPSRADV